MIRTQIQIPEPLYRELKRVAAQLDWSLAEVLRRGGELLVARYPKRTVSQEQEEYPTLSLGECLIDLKDFNAEVDAIEAKFKHDFG
jgi:hypothetical protein